MADDTLSTEDAPDGRHEVLSSPSLNLEPLPQVAKMTLYDGISLLVGLQVGSGIFSSPSQVDNHAPSPGAALIIWIVCGLIAWAGAASFAELGAAIPVNGGMQEYLHNIYGNFLSFLASWIWIFAVKPSSMAILSLIFAEYWTSAILPTTSNTHWLDKLVALIALGTMILLNALSTRTTAQLANVFLYIKLSTVLLLIICCIVVAGLGIHIGISEPNPDWKQRNWFSTRLPNEDGSIIDWSSAGIWAMLGQYTTALYAGLWAYAGWDNANMVAGEMRSPSRDLPRAIHTALPIVIFCFLAANLSYYILVPWAEIGASNTVAVKAGKIALGNFGGILFAILVSAACLGSVNINIFTTARLTSGAAKLGYLPSVLEDIGFRGFKPGQESEMRHNSRWGTASLQVFWDFFAEGPLWMTPLKAMAFNASITMIYILVGNFGALVTFIGIAEYTFFFLTVLGLLILRVQKPSLLRPYRPFIGMPILFSIISLLLVLRGVVVSPIQGVVLIALIITGGLWHWLKDGSMLSRWQGLGYERVST